MSNVPQLIRLLERWRDAGSLERVRVTVDAARIVGGMSPEAKRALAIEVARRVAPQLVPRIQDETGDLTPEQMQALLDLLRRADREDIDDLVTALKSGDVAPALAFVDDAMDVISPPPPDSQPGAPAADGDAAPTSPPVSVAAGAAAAATAAASSPPNGEAPEVTVDTTEVDPELAERAEAVEQALTDEATLIAEAEAAAARSSDRFRATSVSINALDPSSFDLDLDLSFDLDVMPDPEVEVVAPLGQRRTDGTDTDLARPARRAGPISAVVAAVSAQPEGFRRRRAALAAIRDGRATGGDILDLMQDVARNSDRAWVLGAAIDAGLLDAGDLDGLGLPAATRRRLARRG